jgi:hypothetical protein
MIHELRTYTIKTEYGGVRELERRFGNGLDVRLKYSDLGGFFHTRSGNMSQVVHIWPYRDLRDRAESRAAANRDASNRWPPGIAELFERQEVEILLPAPFMPPLQPLQAGSLWQLCWFDYPPADVEAALADFGAAWGESGDRGRAIGCWTVDAGPSQGRIYTLAALGDWPPRDEAQAAAAVEAWTAKAGLKPLARGAKLLEPSHFSPLS